MNEELSRLKDLLLTGQRLSMQGSYERRLPNKEALPYLHDCRKGCRNLLQNDPKSLEAWMILSNAEECLLNYPAARKALESFFSNGGERGKKNLKRLALLKEYERKWVELMLSPADLNALGVYISDMTNESGCNHSLRYTQHWLEMNSSKKVEEILKVLEKHGGYCDCEVLNNVVT